MATSPASTKAQVLPKQATSSMRASTSPISFSKAFALAKAPRKDPLFRIKKAESPRSRDLFTRAHDLSCKRALKIISTLEDELAEEAETMFTLTES